MGVTRQGAQKQLNHSLVGLLAMLIIASFWLSTLIAELFLFIKAITWVKQSIVLGLFVLILAPAAVYLSWKAQAGQSHLCA